MAKKVVLGGGSRVFQSQKAAMDFYREILWKYQVDEEVSSEQDFQALVDLIENHPESMDKIGVGIAGFFVSSAHMGTRCFYLRRVDESFTDFGIGYAVRGERPSVLYEFKEACRAAVRPSINKAKRLFFENYGDEEGRVCCDVTGEMVSQDECHIDHKGALSFNVLVEMFIDANGINVTRDLVSAPSDNQYVAELVDPEMKKRWIEMHTNSVNRNKSLRIVKKEVNLKLASSAKIAPSKNPIILEVG